MPLSARIHGPPGGEDPVVIQTTPHVARSRDRSTDGSSVVEVVSAAGGVPAVHRPLAGQLRQMLHVGELDLPLPGAGQTARRWAALADWGGRDLSLARLAEGHVDALAILAEAGRSPVPGALYGVWASRSGGAAVRLEQGRTSGVLTGEMRFCSGARVLDRVLLVADPAED
jgi:hypothetical protein